MNPFLFRRIRGPVFLLCFAVTAILNQWHILSFGASWPLYIITAGLLRLAETLIFFAAPQWGTQLAFPRRSMSGGVVLLIVGCIALLVTTGTLPSFQLWGGFGMWWPLLLIIFGVLMLVERTFERTVFTRRFPNGGYVPPRHHGGGLVTLVVILVLLGVFSHHHRYIWNSGDWDFPSEWGEHFGGPSYTNSVSLQQPIAANGKLAIENARGDVQISTSADSMIHVEASQTAHVSEHQKNHTFDQGRPQLSVTGDSGRLVVPDVHSLDTRLELQVPAGVQCSIETSHGTVTISGLEKPVQIKDDHGDVTLDSLGAGAHLTLDHGDVTARSLGGDIEVYGSADDVDFSTIHGKVVLHGEFYGDTQLAGIDGSVDYRSSRTNFMLPALTGSLSLDSDDLHINGAPKGLQLNTRSKDIEADGVAGVVSVNDSDSDIHVQALQPLGNISLTDSNGDVTLELPPGSSFHVEGDTGSDDTIASDFPMVQSTEGSGKSIRGQVGSGGPQITLRTNHGDLNLRRGSGEMPERPEQPEKPERPEKPDAGATHMRHIHTDTPPAAPSVQ